MAGKGPRNDITDVAGIRVGGAEDENVNTGVSVVLPDAPMIVAGDVRGGGPGTRETDLLDPSTLVDRADAITLAGGSAYGLAAADGVAAELGALGRGFSLVARVGVPPSPIVPAAILYDLANGGDKSWGNAPPYAALGRAAFADAEKGAAVRLGRAGAGFGARAGSGAGGLGSASYIDDDGVSVGALVAVNAFGSPRIPGSAAFWAHPFELDDEFGGARPHGAVPVGGFPPDTKVSAGARANTTIGVIAIGAALTQPEARRIAIMAHTGLARALRPAHGPTDGDCLFVLAAGGPAPKDALDLTRWGSIAADVVARAIARGVYEAERRIG